MGFKAGQPRPENAGRKKGTPNKDSQDLFAICAKHGIDVFEGMVMLAVSCLNENERFQRLKELAPYLYSKRKDLTVGIDQDKNEIRIIVEDYGSKK